MTKFMFKKNLQCFFKIVLNIISFNLIVQKLKTCKEINYELTIIFSITQIQFKKIIK